MARRRTWLTEEQVCEVIDEILMRGEVSVDDEIVSGESVSFLVNSLRDKGSTISGNDYAFTDKLEKLGYRTVKGKVGKWTKGGFQYCQPARCLLPRK